MKRRSIRRPVANPLKLIASGSLVLACASCGIAAAGAASLQSGNSATPSPTPTAANQTTTVTIDSSAGETFSPPGPATSPQLTAQQAWVAFVNSEDLDSSATASTNTGINPDVAVTFGRLTLPSSNSGPQSTWTYTAYNEPAYAYMWTTTCNSRMDGVSYSCTRWTFLNANTGALLDDVGTPTS
jgi:hypothetical protein